MNARLRATWLAAVLAVAFGVVLMVQPTGYTVLSPGETVDLLGTDGTSPLITIPGHKTYRDQGQLRMLTVELLPPSQKLSLPAAIGDWLNDDTSVYPSVVWYPAGTSDKSSQQQGAQQMTSALDLARAAALQAAGIKVPVVTSAVFASVDAKGPSAGKIQPGDIVTSVNGVSVSTVQGVVAAIKKQHPGDLIAIGLRRGTEMVRVTIKSVAKGTSGPSANEARIGVGLAESDHYRFPFKININIPDNIGGGSGGMMLALTIYDLLTSGHLTGGHVIAGTGTIGSGPGPGLQAVGPIGGIDQKIKGAQRDGAQLFLAPAANCDEVRNATYNHKIMKIVQVSTLQDAITAITRWTKNPNDPALKGC